MHAFLASRPASTPSVLTPGGGFRLKSHDILLVVDSGGHANGWSGKPAFFVVHLATLAGTAALLSTIGWIMPWFPKSTVNLPHKEYWLSEQQAAKTYAVLSAQMMWFAAGTVAFFIGLGHLVFRANLLPQPRLSDGVWWLLVGYLAFTTIWCAGLLVRFARRPRDA